MWAQFEPGEALVLDFANVRVLGDAAAWAKLRLGRELPVPVPAASPVGLGSEEREMDLMLWDLGIAAGPHALLNVPEDWWHVPLVPVKMATVSRYTHHSLHLDMARGGVTPLQLQLECRASAGELRSFLQACLFLLLAHWQPRVDSGD